MLGVLESDVEVVATRAGVVRMVALHRPVQVLFGLTMSNQRCG